MTRRGGEDVSVDGSPARREPVRARLCPDGPLLLRGADEVVAADGTVHPVTRPVVAVCACGRSGRAPWCDGTHAYVKPRRTS